MNGKKRDKEGRKREKLKVKLSEYGYNEKYVRTLAMKSVACEKKNETHPV